MPSILTLEGLTEIVGVAPAARVSVAEGDSEVVAVIVTAPASSNVFTVFVLLPDETPLQPRHSRILWC